MQKHFSIVSRIYWLMFAITSLFSYVSRKQIWLKYIYDTLLYKKVVSKVILYTLFIPLVPNISQNRPRKPLLHTLRIVSEPKIIRRKGTVPKIVDSKRFFERQKITYLGSLKGIWYIFFDILHMCTCLIWFSSLSYLVRVQN